MQGYQLTFYTHQGRQHQGKPIAEWLFEVAKKLNVSGATMLSANEGFGHGGKIHSAHFFELSDQPLMVSMVVSEQEKQQILQLLQDEKARIFYVASAVEYGFTAAE